MVEWEIYTGCMQVWRQLITSSVLQCMQYQVRLSTGRSYIPKEAISEASAGVLIVDFGIDLKRQLNAAGSHYNYWPIHAV